jgi:hypothetical protein
VTPLYWASQARVWLGQRCAATSAYSFTRRAYPSRKGRKVLITVRMSGLERQTESVVLDQSITGFDQSRKSRDLTFSDVHT